MKGMKCFFVIFALIFGCYGYVIDDVVDDELELCTTIIDIGFILDSSGSLTYHYQDEKNFLKTLSKVFGVSEEGTHAGVVSFSSAVKLSVKLNECKNQKCFDEKVDKIKLMGRATRIDKALEFSLNQLFKPSNGARKGVPKLLVLITDGAHTVQYGSKDPIKIAENIRKAGINTLMIGIGPKINKQELSSMAGRMQKWYTAADWNVLKSVGFLRKMAKTVCQTAGEEEEKKCTTVIDIGFTLDSSGSLTYHYQDEKDFVKSLSKVFGVSEEGSHAGVVSFSSGVKLSVKLNECKNQKCFDEKVDKIKLMGRATRIDKALEFSSKQLFNPSNGARKGVPKLLVLITDGAHTVQYGSKDPIKIAEKIRKAGINTLIIGIGPKINKKELSRMAGRKQKWYTAANWNVLKSSGFLTEMGKTVCEVAEEGSS